MDHIATVKGMLIVLLINVGLAHRYSQSENGESLMPILIKRLRRELNYIIRTFLALGLLGFRHLSYTLFCAVCMGDGYHNTKSK